MALSHGGYGIASQKARGVVRLALKGPTVLPQWLHAVEDINVLPLDMPSIGNSVYFARPCPVRPRHGFVDSRPIRNNRELLNLWGEMIQADPQGEMILMPVLTGRSSAVATDCGVTWGHGNDGVTGANGKQWHIPLSVENQAFTRWSRKYFSMHTDIRDAAYAECVEHNGRTMIVQLRDGPALKVGHRQVYFPSATYKVEHVVEPTDEELHDLLAWERRAKSLQPGTVIWLPSGGLSSHVAVHGVVAGLCVICAGQGFTRRDLEIGTVLRAPADAAPKLRPVDYGRMAKYLRNRPLLTAAPYFPDVTHSAKGSKSIRRAEATAFSVATLHSMPHWGREPHLLRLRVEGVRTLVLLLAAACLGEMRHYFRVGPGRSDWSCGKWWTTRLGIEAPSRFTEHDRSAVFSAALAKVKLADLPEMFADMVHDFNAGWGNASRASREALEGRVRERHGSTGYGGPNWAKASRMAQRLAEALLAFQAAPNEATWTTVTRHYNKAVAAVHNGGTLLSKFLDQSQIDRAVRVPQLAFMSPFVMQLVCPPQAKPVAKPAPKLSQAEQWDAAMVTYCNTIAAAHPYSTSHHSAARKALLGAFWDIYRVDLNLEPNKDQAEAEDEKLGMVATISKSSSLMNLLGQITNRQAMVPAEAVADFIKQLVRVHAAKPNGFYFTKPSTVFPVLRQNRAEALRLLDTLIETEQMQSPWSDTPGDWYPHYSNSHLWLYFSTEFMKPAQSYITETFKAYRWALQPERDGLALPEDSLAGLYSTFLGVPWREPEPAHVPAEPEAVELFCETVKPARRKSRRKPRRARTATPAPCFPQCDQECVSRCNLAANIATINATAKKEGAANV